MLPVTGAKSNSTYRPRSLTRDSTVSADDETLADEPGLTVAPLGIVAVKPPSVQPADVAADAGPAATARPPSSTAEERATAAAPEATRRRGERMRSCSRSGARAAPRNGYIRTIGNPVTVEHWTMVVVPPEQYRPKVLAPRSDGELPAP